MLAELGTIEGLLGLNKTGVSLVALPQPNHSSNLAVISYYANKPD